MSTDPTKNVNDRVVGQPQDTNRRPLSALVFPIVSAGEVIGYLYPKVVDNGDGTATLSQTVNVTLDADVDIGNLHLLNTSDVKIDPATEQKQDDIIAQLVLNEQVKLWDGTNVAGITADGRIKIDTSPPDAPPATTPVVVTKFSSVSGSADNVFVIPNGETLIIQRFSAGAEVDSVAGNVVELFIDADGTGTTLSIIDVIFASGDGDQHDLRETIVGDGSKAIRMRRRRFGGGSKEIFGRWEGYY